MNKKVLIVLIVVGILAYAECHKGRKGHHNRRRDSKSSESSDIEGCDELCERKAPEMPSGRGRDCMRSRRKLTECTRSRRGSKSKEKKNNEKQRERDCECEKRQMVSRNFGGVGTLKANFLNFFSEYNSVNFYNQHDNS